MIFLTHSCLIINHTLTNKNQSCRNVEMLQGFCLNNHKCELNGLCNSMRVI